MNKVHFHFVWKLILMYIFVLFCTATLMCRIKEKVKVRFLSTRED